MSDDPVAARRPRRRCRQHPDDPIEVLGNDTDVDGDRLRVLDVSQPNGGTAATSSRHAPLYRPREDFQGSDSLRLHGR
ncbi:MAG: cadherin-like domain-containing protein [Desulfobacterales bacterium]|nr:cadherin-like domain-containing protein [Desulfobacterales bacterium]